MIRESSSSSFGASRRSAVNKRPARLGVDRSLSQNQITPSAASRASRIGSPGAKRALARKSTSANTGKRALKRALPGPGPLDRPIALSNPPPAMEADASMSPQQLSAHIASRHRALLTDTKKSTAYSMWSLSVLGRGTNAVAGGGAEAAAAFGVLAVIGQVYDAYSTHSDARKAKDDFATAGLLLTQQASELAEAETRLARLTEAAEEGAVTDPDQLAAAKQHIEVCAFNIKALETLRKNYLKAYYGEDQQDCIEAHLERFGKATADLSADLIAIDRLERALQSRKADLETVTDLAGDIDTDELEDQVATLNAECLGLQRDLDAALDRHAKRVDALPDLLSIAAIKREIQAELTALKAGHKAGIKAAAKRAPAPRFTVDGTPIDPQKEHDEKVAALEARHKALSRPSARKLVFRPFEGLAHQEIKRIRDVPLQGTRAAADLSAVALNVAGEVTSLTAATLGALGTGLLSGTLGLYMARLDMKDAKRELKAASASKAVALEKIATAGKVVANMRAAGSALSPSQRAMGRAAAWALMRSQSRVVRVLHRASLQAHTRGNKATANFLNGGLGLALTLSALVVGGLTASVATGGLVTAPAVAIGAGIGLGYLGSVAVRAGQRKAEKDELKARSRAARAFVQRFGIDGYRQLINDVEAGDEESLFAWKIALDDLAATLKNSPGASAKALADFNWSLFSPERIKDNEFLLVDLLAHGLHGQARDHVPMDQSDEAAVLKALKMPVETIRFILASHDSRPTSADHLANTKFLLCNFLGIKDYPDDRLPLHRSATVSHNVASMNQLLAGCSDPLYRLVRHMAEHPDATARDLRRTFSREMPELLNELKALRSDAQRQHLIGAEQLIELQAHTRKLHPLRGTWLVEEGSARNRVGPSPSSREQLEVAYLLELLADPTRLEPVARPAPVAPLSALDDTGDGPARLKDLNSAMKARGDALRLKQSPQAPAPADPKDTTSNASADRPRSRSTRLRKSLGQHARSKLSNPMGSPRMATTRLEELRQKHDQAPGAGRATEVLVDDVSHILADLAARAFGSADRITTLPENTDDAMALLIDQLDNPRPDVPQGGRDDEAYVLPLQTMLESIVATAETTADWIERERRGLTPTGEPKDSRSLDRVTERMLGLRDLARQLQSVLANPVLRRLTIERMEQLGVRHGQFSTV
ncbi:hypothetical protein ACLIJR_12700 [Hydrogenophaga sp. XSHU_21]